MVMSAFTNRKFLPADVLATILTKESVRRALIYINAPSNDVDDLVSFIVPRARKIFAILLLFEWDAEFLLRGIQCFQRESIRDEFLPITKENRDNVPFFINREGPWRRRVSEFIFCKKQWVFLTPELPPEDVDGPILRLHAKAILPIIQAKKVDAGATLMSFGIYRTRSTPGERSGGVS
ncbi:hypothetical protein B0T20DRAFT_174397 [Sordaria brevicollis]|uniref:Uncharacterized protein n=1 Tax=Sordaria brevicollis TaxID=83679 RepID=A0AAE0PHE8_SORBR|nr:hypothetical protein B0T20DRAFT_174397 [Sordaria brevicollis]